MFDTHVYLFLQVKKPGTKKVPKNAPKGVAKGSAGGKKKKSTLKYTIDCTHPVEDGIMDPANFVRFIKIEQQIYRRHRISISAFFNIFEHCI